MTCSYATATSYLVAAHSPLGGHDQGHGIRRLKSPESYDHCSLPRIQLQCFLS